MGLLSFGGAHPGLHRPFKGRNHRFRVVEGGSQSHRCDCEGTYTWVDGSPPHLHASTLPSQEVSAVPSRIFKEFGGAPWFKQPMPGRSPCRICGTLSVEKRRSTNLTQHGEPTSESNGLWRHLSVSRAMRLNEWTTNNGPSHAPDVWLLPASSMTMK